MKEKVRKKKIQNKFLSLWVVLIFSSIHFVNLKILINQKKLQLLNVMWHSYSCSTVQQNFENLVVITMCCQNERGNIRSKGRSGPIYVLPALRSLKKLPWKHHNIKRFLDVVNYCLISYQGVGHSLAKCMKLRIIRIFCIKKWLFYYRIKKPFVQNENITWRSVLQK